MAGAETKGEIYRFFENWEQAVTWHVILVVLYA